MSFSGETDEEHRVFDVARSQSLGRKTLGKPIGFCCHKLAWGTMSSARGRGPMAGVRRRWGCSCKALSMPGRGVQAGPVVPGEACVHTQSSLYPVERSSSQDMPWLVLDGLGGARGR